MIQLHPDCLLFKTPGGEAIPCSAELISVNLLGEAADLLDHDLVENAARAVLHYFKVEQGKTFVSMREFSLVLAKVLRGFGLSVNQAEAAAPPRRISESDLRQLACESGKGFELAFFPRLRDELRQQLNQSPQVLRFKGLRSCVKQLAGARRWTDRCQCLSDQIVDYLRRCLSDDPGAKSCSLMVL
jgi:hypothetical protein